MSYYIPSHNRHVYAPRARGGRLNLSWSTIREETSSDLFGAESQEKKDTMNRLRKLERLKQRRYVDYQTLKRRGSSQEYSDRFQRDCEEFNKLKYRQVHHTPSTMLYGSRQKSISVSDISPRRHSSLYTSRYGYSHFRSNQDDGHTLSPTGSVSSIATLDDDCMYGSRYSGEDHWASWRPRHRTSSLSMSSSHDRMNHYGFLSHETIDDSLFDDTASEYGYSSYMPQRRAFSSCVTPRKYSGMMTPTAESADAMATYERMNQLSERLKTLQSDRARYERRQSLDLSGSRHRLASTEYLDSTSVHGRYSQASGLSQSPTDQSNPSWSHRVNLLLSPSHDQTNFSSTETDYHGGHFESGAHYTTKNSESYDPYHSTEISSVRSLYSMDPTESLDSASNASTLPRSFAYHRPDTSSISASIANSRRERIAAISPSYTGSTETYHASAPVNIRMSHTDTHHRSNQWETSQESSTQHYTGSSPTRTITSRQFSRSGIYGADIQHSTAPLDIHGSYTESQKLSSSQETNQESTQHYLGSSPTRTVTSRQFTGGGVYGADTQHTSPPVDIRTSNPNSYPESQPISPIQEANPESPLQQFGGSPTRTVTSRHFFKSNVYGANPNFTSQRSLDESRDLSPNIRSPGAQNSTFTTYEKKTYLVRRGVDDIADSGVEDASDADRIGTTATDSVSTFSVSASKPSESRGKSKFEISKGPSNETVESSRTSLGDSISDEPARDLRDTSQYPSVRTSSVTIQKSSDDNTTELSEIPGGSRSGRAPSETDGGSPQVIGSVEESASTKISTLNFDLSSSKNDGSIQVDPRGRSQQQDTKTMNISQTRPSTKKPDSSSLENPENRHSSTVTLNLEAPGHGFSGDPTETKSNLQYRQVPSVQKESEELAYGSSETVTVQRVSSVDSRNSVDVDYSVETVEQEDPEQLKRSPTPKKKKSKKKKSFKGEKNGKNSVSKTEEEPSSLNSSTNPELCSPVLESGRPKVSQLGTEETTTLTTYTSTTEVARKDYETVFTPNGNMTNVQVSSVDLPPKFYEEQEKEGNASQTVGTRDIPRSALTLQANKGGRSKASSDIKSQNEMLSLSQNDRGGVMSPSQNDRGGVMSPSQNDRGGVMSQSQNDRGGVMSSSQNDRGGVMSSSQNDRGGVMSPSQNNRGGVMSPSQNNRGGVMSPSQNNRGDNMIPQSSPHQEQPVTPSAGLFLVDKESLPSQNITGITFVETKQLMNATLDSVNQLQSTDRISSVDENKDKSLSIVTSKLSTVSYQSISSPVDSGQPKVPGQTYEEKPLAQELSDQERLIQGTPTGPTAPELSNQEQGLPTGITAPENKTDPGVKPRGQSNSLNGITEERVVVTTTKTTVSEVSDTLEIYKTGLGCVVYPDRSQQVEMSQGIDANKTVPTVDISGPRKDLSGVSEDYKVKSVSAEFPGQPTEIGKSGEVVPEGATILQEEMDPNAEPSKTSKKGSQGPKRKKQGKSSPSRKRSDPSQIPPELLEEPESPKGGFFGRFASSIKNTFSKGSPGAPEKTDPKFPSSPTDPDDSFSSVDPVQSGVDQKVSTPQVREGRDDYIVPSVSSEEKDAIQGNLSQRSPTNKTTTVKTISLKTSKGPHEGPKFVELPGVDGTKTVIIETTTTTTRTTLETSGEFKGQEAPPGGDKTKAPQGLTESLLRGTPPSAILGEYTEPRDGQGAPPGGDKYKAPQGVTESLPRGTPPSAILGEYTEPRNDKVIVTSDTTLQFSEIGPGAVSETTSYNEDLKIPRTLDLSTTEKELKSEEPRFQGEGDVFGKVITTSTKETVSYKTLENPEDYPLQKMSSELPVSITAPQEIGILQDKAVTVTKTIGFKEFAENSESLGEYPVQSVSAEFPGGAKSPTKTEFSQGPADLKTGTITLSTGREIVPELYGVSKEMKTTSMPTVQYDPISVAQEQEIVTKTAIIAESLDPEIPEAKVQPELPNKEETVQQPNVSGKVITVSKNVAYTIEKTVCENPEQLKSGAITLKEEKPDLVAEAKKNGDNKTKEEKTVNLPKQKSKNSGKLISLTRKGSKKKTEITEEPNAESAETVAPSKNKQKEKTGFLGKMATSLKSSFSKKNPEIMVKSESLPESVQESITIETKTTELISEDFKPSEEFGVGTRQVLSTDQTPRISAEDPTSQRDIIVHQNISDANVGVDTKPGESQLTSKNSVSPATLQEIPVDFRDGILTQGSTDSAKTKSDISEEFYSKSVSVTIPQQQEKVAIETKIQNGRPPTTTVETSAYKISDIKEDRSYKILENPEDYYLQKMSSELPVPITAPQEIGILQDKAVTVTKTIGFKEFAENSESLGEYPVQSVSAEFPGDAKSPTKTEFSQGPADLKPGTVTLSTGKEIIPELYGVSKEIKTTSMPTELYNPISGNKMDPEILDVTGDKRMSSELPERITMAPKSVYTQSQDNVFDKVVTVSKTTEYKKSPRMSERPEEYHVQSGSVNFPSEVYSPTQTEFSEGYMADKVVMATALPGNRTASGTSEEFPVLYASPQVKQPQSAMAPNAAQVSYKTVLERGIKPLGEISSEVAPRTNLSVPKTDSYPQLSQRQILPGEEFATIETRHFNIEEQVTISKPTPKSLTSELTDSIANSSTQSGAIQLQDSRTSLSQQRNNTSVTTMELSNNLKNLGIDPVSQTPGFLTEPLKLGSVTQQKSWSDVVKTGKNSNINAENIPAGLNSSISKAAGPSDRSARPQQTEFENKMISGETEAFVTRPTKNEPLYEYADTQPGDVVAPLKAKPAPMNRPLLRQLTGHDFDVADVEKEAKPTLKLVAPDCTLLQTKFETDGWKPQLKSPTATSATATLISAELVSSPPTTLEQVHISTPVAPKRRSREFRSASEESDVTSPTSDSSSSTFPKGTQPQIPKRRPKRGSKNNRTSSSSGSSNNNDLDNKYFNASLNPEGSRPLSDPVLRLSDPEAFLASPPTSPLSPLESEARQKLLTEPVISLNKTPQASDSSDTANIGSTQELIAKSPKVAHFQQPDDAPVRQPPHLERSQSSDKSRTLPLNRKKVGRNSQVTDDDDSDGDAKPNQPLSLPSQQKKWKSAEMLKVTPTKADPQPKANTGLNRVKSTSIKLLSKLQPKSKRSKSPGAASTSDSKPQDGAGVKDYPTLEKYPGNKAKDPNSIQSPDEGEKTEPAGAGAAPLAPLRIPVPQDENEEPIKERVYLRSWDPTPLLKELYAIRLMDDNTEDLSHHFIEMEGLMEKLPMNKKKATLLKTWKRRYFHAKNGWLIYYDNRNDEKPSDEVLLMGGEIHVIGNQVIGIDDGRGRYLMVRCPSQKEYNLWLTSLQSQTTDNTRATYVRPEIDVPKNPDKKVVMIEFGSLSIRAGILREKPSLPQLFFPNIVALHQEGNVVKHVIGFDAYKPEIRHSSQLVQPFGPTDKVDKFKIDFETLPSVFSAIFKDLKIASEEYYVMLILPVNIRDEDKSMLMDILIKQFRVCGVCMAPQALLALYSYNAQSGIVVDIGERIEVLPIYEGFVIDGGHAVKPFGAPKIRQTLRSGLTSENYPLYSPLEQLLVRLVMEQTCFVSKNFNEDCQQFQRNPEKFQETIYLKKYDLPEDTYTSICHSLSRFVSPEGLFNMDLWGMDYPTIQSLVKNAIEACPMDNRRHLCRSIYLSGGVTLLPGFAQRLETELQKHLNETLVIQVHSSPQRYHAAYIGACALGLLPEFESSCVTSEEWEKEGTKAFQKWKMTS